MDFGASSPEISPGHWYSGVAGAHEDANLSASDRWVAQPRWRPALVLLIRPVTLCTHPGELARRVMTTHPASANADSAAGGRRVKCSGRCTGSAFAAV
jgi:hypothetical protein